MERFALSRAAREELDIRERLARFVWTFAIWEYEGITLFGDTRQPRDVPSLLTLVREERSEFRDRLVGETAGNARIFDGIPGSGSGDPR